MTLYWHSSTNRRLMVLCSDTSFLLTYTQLFTSAIRATQKNSSFSYELLVYLRAATNSLLSYFFSHWNSHSSFNHFCSHVLELSPSVVWTSPGQPESSISVVGRHRHTSPGVWGSWPGQKMLCHLCLALDLVPLAEQAKFVLVFQLLHGAIGTY